MEFGWPPSQFDVMPLNSTTRRPSTKGPLPLSILLVNYAKRRIGQLTKDSRHGKQSTFLLALVGVILLLAGSSILKGHIPATESLDVDGFAVLHERSLWADVPSPATVEEEVSSKIAHLGASSEYPVCTFPMESAGQYHMTALPADIASKVLKSWSTSTTSGGLHIPTHTATPGIPENVSTPEDSTFEDTEGGKSIVEKFVDVAASVAP